MHFLCSIFQNSKQQLPAHTFFPLCSAQNTKAQVKVSRQPRNRKNSADRVFSSCFRLYNEPEIARKNGRCISCKNKGIRHIIYLYSSAYLHINTRYTFARLVGCSDAALKVCSCCSRSSSLFHPLSLR